MPAWDERGMFLASLPPGYAEETVPEDAALDWLEMSGLLPGGPADKEPISGPGSGPGSGPALGSRSGSGSGSGSDSGSGFGSGFGSGLAAARPSDGAAGGPSDSAGFLRPSARRTTGHASRLVLCPCRPGSPGDFRLRRVGLARVELSSFLPVLESFGLAVVEAVPWHFQFGPGQPDAYVDDIGLRVDTPLMEPGMFDPLGDGARLVDALEAVLSGRGELGPLNRLVIGAGLDWRQVALLCTYCAYRRVVGGPWSADAADAMSGALVAFPGSALAAVRLFVALLVPGSGTPADEARAAMLEAFSAVPDLEHDKALHELAFLLEATTRTNWALGGATISVKFASSAIPFLPAPQPMAETFVWCPWFEGLHVRFGLVARGGIRWSDRQADLRSEVLGLARAQVKKNSLIVPTGAKGGFVLRKDDAVHQDPGHLELGKSAYAAFIEALLDVTDNVVEGKPVHPEGVTCRDGDDPYLVVAPDKGTAHFSDLANSISARRGFWLGDAFASGGSSGYDHKALGITARGAWVAVRRHFRALGMDAQREPLRVVGVGDMSGDVFGNGMLQSQSICLVAAFDHRHIFVDPSPDPDMSYGERLRLSQLEHSSWQDYDLKTASHGSAVYSRHAKRVELSPRACGALGVVGTGQMSPPELVKAVLEAQVDLIFFGGIGTFVKEAGETDRDVDDRANDDVRVNADQLRARVVAEGANLAMTQRARTSYSRRGGRVDTDFIDNAGGVAMSDREVNLKILFGLALGSGRLAPAERDEVLANSANAVADAVLAQVEQSVVALDRAAVSSAADLPAFEALMEDLARAGLLDVEVEALPDAEELDRRRPAGAGLSRPELAVLVAYARSELARSIGSSPLPGFDALRSCGVSYFPPAVRHDFSDLIPEHPLFGQLVSSELADELIARMGAVWAHEVAAETGRQPWEAAAAYWAAREVLGAGPLFEEVDTVAWTVSPEAENALRDCFSSALGRLARWYLARPGLFDQTGASSAGAGLGGEGSAGGGHGGEGSAGAGSSGGGSARGGLAAEIAADRPFVGQLNEAGPNDGASPAGPMDIRPLVAQLVALGAPEDLSVRIAQLVRDAAVGELAEVARATGRHLGDVMGAYEVVEEGLGLEALSNALAQRESLDRWQRWELDLLGDDLAHTRVAAVTRSLQAHPHDAGDQAAREWLAVRPGPLARTSQLVSRVGTGSAGGLAIPALALRALGEAVRA